MAAKPTKKTSKTVALRLELTPEQLKKLSTKAKALSAGKLVISVVSKQKLIGKIKVAGYSYHGSTCCA